MKEKLKRYVLIQKNGKQATRENQSMIATKIEAVRIDRSGRGGGIVDALLPTTEKEEKILVDAEKKYIVKLVDGRKKGDFAKTREAVAVDDYLMVRLAEMYLNSMENAGKEPIARVQQFTIWLCEELKNPASRARSLLECRDWALADRQTPSWWEKQIAARRKRLNELEKSKK